MAGILIRPATVADLPFLWAMLYEAAFVPDETRAEWRARPEPPAGLAKYLDGWGRPGDAGVIAEANAGHPAGAAWYRLFHPAERGAGVLARAGVPELGIAVDRGCRRRGVGRALLVALMQRGREDGYRELVLSVAPENTGAIRLYELVGFRDAYAGDPTAGTSRYMSAGL